MTFERLRDFGRDAGWAARLLRRRPGFGAVVILTLALGIGAPTTIFSVVHAVLLQPLPYREPDRIVHFRIESRSPRGDAAFDALPVTAALRWAAESTTLSSLAIYNDRALTLSTPDGPFRLTGIAANPNLFDLLGAAPVAGRTFNAAARDAREIVLSHATWTRHFHADRSVVGSAITLDGMSYVVTGVMGESFRFPTREAAFWVPLLLDSGGGRGMLLPAIARLRPAVTIEAVVAEGRRILGDTGDTRIQERLLARTLQAQMVGGVERMLWILMAAVTMVFVIATANIALLLLTRGASREREFSIRLALGAGRARLMRQLIVEGTLMAAVGGLAGLMVAAGALEALVRIAPRNVPRLEEASLDPQVLLFTVLVTLFTSLVFGVLSAGRTLAIDPLRALGAPGSESRLVTASISRTRLNALAAAEVALTMVLLVGAGLLIRSFARLALVDPGFTSKRALALQISLPASRYPNPIARLAFHERLLERLTHLDRITSAGLITSMPNRQPSGRFGYDPLGVDAFPEPFSQKIAEVRMATEGFIEAAGIPLLAGRTLRLEDGAAGEPVMVISSSLARLHFADKDPVGQMLYSGSGTRRVVGVVGDVLPAEPRPQLSPAAYLPLRQSTDILEWFAGINVIVRGKDPSALVAPIRAVVLSLDSEIAPFNVRTLDAEVAALTAGPRFSATLLSMFAVVALVMAAIGVYGVMAYTTGLRTPEIGLRIALGATRRQVLGLMIRDGVFVVAAGLISGLIAAVWLAQTLTGLLYEVTPADPLALISVAALLAVIGLTAAYIPARRATRVSALSALRHEP